MWSALAPRSILRFYSVHSERSTALRQAQEPRLRPERSTERSRRSLAEGSRRSLVELHSVLSTQHFALKLRVLSAMPTKLPKNPDTCE